MTTTVKPAPGELLDAVRTRNIEHARILLERGADPNESDVDGNTCLMYATMRNSQQLAEMLIEKGADIEAKGHYDITALMYAARDDIGILRLLIEKGASLDEKTNVLGETALDWAETVGTIEAVKILKEAPEIRRLAEEKAARQADQAKNAALLETAATRQIALNKSCPKVKVRLA
jgi:ankyrin repeat protein